ncbi:MAG: serine--tRNA ligase, partial [Fidelibacterota bacterium]
MLALRYIRDHPERVKTAVSHRGESVDVDRILELDLKMRGRLQEVEELRAKRNRASERISELKKGKGDAGSLIEEMRTLSSTIKEKESRLADIRKELEELLLWVPNIPHESVPVGEDEKANVELRKWGEPPEF